jgi:hypothetical protein
MCHQIVNGQTGATWLVTQLQTRASGQEHGITSIHGKWFAIVNARPDRSSQNQMDGAGAARGVVEHTKWGTTQRKTACEGSQVDLAE